MLSLFLWKSEDVGSTRADDQRETAFRAKFRWHPRSPVTGEVDALGDVNFDATTKEVSSWEKFVNITQVSPNTEGNAMCITIKANAPRESELNPSTGR